MLMSWMLNDTQMMMLRCITSATPRRYHLQPVRDRVASANTSVARVALPRSKLTSLLLRSWQRTESHREAETSIFSWQRNRQGTHCRCHFYRKTRGKRSERSWKKGRNSSAENMRKIVVWNLGSNSDHLSAPWSGGILKLENREKVIFFITWAETFHILSLWIMIVAVAKQWPCFFNLLNDKYTLPHFHLWEFAFQDHALADLPMIFAHMALFFKSWPVLLKNYRGRRHLPFEDGRVRPMVGVMEGGPKKAQGAPRNHWKAGLRDLVSECSRAAGKDRPAKRENHLRFTSNYWKHQ